MFDLDAFKNDFERRFGSRPTVFSAPGRVNLIGEHTDYNEGFVLPFAIDKRTFVAAVGRTDDVFNVYTLTLDKGDQFRLDEASIPRHEDWTLYVRGMVSVLRRDGAAVAGADILIDSEIPFGAGLSSSAALEVGIGYALAELSGSTIDRRHLAFAGQNVEHEFIGVRSGIMDQFASALGRNGNAVLIDCRNLTTEYVPLELGSAIFAICDSGVKHSLASSAYNQRREECERGVELLAGKIPGVTSLRDVTLEMLQEFEHVLPALIRRRCTHVITENKRTIDMAATLRVQDLDRAGKMMYSSHESLSDDYEVSCPELDLLVDTARRIPGVYGARMTGGGFGGCTINLLDAAAFDEFKRLVTGAYRREFARDTAIFTVSPSSGVCQEP
ncbi:MAG TPA: galactokinase [Pyrinomonadaceae bacterium]|jgi:galactokinase|nr:galactokinase [Pyrinomonadaceae bacterium]